MPSLPHLRTVALILGAGLLPMPGFFARGDEPARPSPVALDVFPKTLTLDGPRDARRILVTGVMADGSKVDLTATATYQAPEGLVFDRSGFARGSKDGTYPVRVVAGGTAVDLPVTVQGATNPGPVSFVRDVAPVLSRVGCNAGTCHGSAKGKKGFKLSLRGYDLEYDHAQLVDDLAARRFNRSAPDQSLMLLKPTTGVPHEGGQVLQPDSPAYALLRDWIAQGVKSDVGSTARVASLEVHPPVIDLAREDQAQQMLVLARYPGGSSRDVTLDAIYSSSVPGVADVSPAGLITSAHRGEAAILVRYEGAYGVGNVTVMGDRSGFVWKPRPQNNYVDELVDQKLQKVKVLPSAIADDADFLRRASFDLTGLPPTTEQVRAFLLDHSDNRAKRDRAIDAMIDGPEFVAHWTHKWADLLQVDRKKLGDKASWAFLRWIETAISTNMPYDQFVRAVITAQGSSYDSPAVNYYRASREPSVALENATQLFLGVRFSCNKCHDHPFEKWTQDQYYGMAAFWGRVGTKPGPRSMEQVLFDRSGGEVTHPKDGRVMRPGFPYTFGQVARATQADPVRTRREELAGWLTAAENPYFARSLVNRVWSYFLGRGIIDPVDDIRSSNPPSNPELLGALENDFIDHGFDLRHLMRTIARSRTYQSSILTNAWNEDDTVNFSHAGVRRLTAEQLSDAIDRAAGRKPRFAGVPPGFRANQLPDSQVAPGGFLDLFGRPARETPCECERSSEVSLGQALNLVNGPTISDALVDPDGRLARLLKSNPDDATIAEEMYLAALSRFPTPDETTRAVAYLSSSPGKLDAAQDLLWALINSPAFLFNR